MLGSLLSPLSNLLLAAGGSMLAALHKIRNELLLGNHSAQLFAISLIKSPALNLPWVSAIVLWSDSTIFKASYKLD